MIKVVKSEEIKKITINNIELDKDKTLELMKETTINNILEELIFWTEYFWVEKGYKYTGGLCPYYKKTRIKPEIEIKVVPESIQTLWKEPETGKGFPLKTKAYLEEEKKKVEELESLTFIETDTTLVIDL